MRAIKIFILASIILLTGCSQSKNDNVAIKVPNNEMVKIGNGSFNCDTTEVHLNSFYISKNKVSIKEWNEIMVDEKIESFGETESLKPVTGKEYLKIAEFCNKKSLQENLIPYYKIENKKISENVMNSGFRLPLEEEFIYAYKYNPSLVEAVEFYSKEREQNIKSVFIRDGDFRELFQNDFREKKVGTKKISGFRVVRNGEYANSTGLRFSKRDFYSIRNNYEVYEIDKFGISFLKPSGWGVAGLKSGIIFKNINSIVRNKFEEGDINDLNRGVIFYDQIFNGERIYEFSVYVYDFKFNIREKDGKRLKSGAEIDYEMVEEFAKIANIGINDVSFYKEKLDEENRSGYKYNFTVVGPYRNVIRLFVYKKGYKGDFLIQFEIRAINENTEIPKEMIKTIFNSITFGKDV